MKLFHKIQSIDYIDMPNWFSKKRQIYTVPYDFPIKGKGRRYNSYKYFKNGKTILVISTAKGYYSEFPLHEALFFSLSSQEIYLSGKDIEHLVQDFFKPSLKKKFG